ncbi:MAG TPA: AsmA family protein [Victivallales bacterium]|nr:AsmA family protein [Victivallales bacterium]HRR28114.1 AsmA family protein [Victivallales bacterium]
MKKSSIKKIKKYIYLTITLLILSVILVIFAIQYHFGKIAKFTIRNTIPQITGTTAEINDASFNILSGELRLNGFTLGNPQGFQTNSAVKIKSFRIKINLLSLLSKTIHIDHIIIDGMKLTYEAGFPSNIEKIKENIDKAKTEEGPQNDNKKKSAKKIYIKELRIINSQINTSVKGIGGVAVTLPVPSILITEIGSEKEGVTFIDTLDRLFGNLITTVQRTGSSTGSYLKDNLKDASEKTKEKFNKLKNILK